MVIEPDPSSSAPGARRSSIGLALSSAEIGSWLMESWWAPMTTVLFDRPGMRAMMLAWCHLERSSFFSGVELDL